MVEDTTMKLVTSFDDVTRLSLRDNRGKMEVVADDRGNYSYDNTDSRVLGYFEVKGYNEITFVPLDDKVIITDKRPKTEPTAKTANT